MIVVISGTRQVLSFSQETRVARIIHDAMVARSEELLEFRVGDCPTGVDAWVRENLDREPAIYEAHWEQLGKAAGPERNRRMLLTPTKADLLLAFPWVEGSRGTRDCIRQADIANIDTVVTWLR